jgi:hypothetical protein
MQMGWLNNLEGDVSDCYKGSLGKEKHLPHFRFFKRSGCARVMKFDIWLNDTKKM